MNQKIQILVFIDSNERSLKVVLLHIANELASTPIDYSVSLKETYQNLYNILGKIKYTSGMYARKTQMNASGMCAVIGKSAVFY